MTMHHGCTAQCTRMSTRNADLTRPDLTRPDPFFHLTSLPRLLISLPQLQTARASDCEKRLDKGMTTTRKAHPLRLIHGETA